MHSLMSCHLISNNFFFSLPMLPSIPFFYHNNNQHPYNLAQKKLRMKSSISMQPVFVIYCMISIKMGANRMLNTTCHLFLNSIIYKLPRGMKRMILPNRFIIITCVLARTVPSIYGPMVLKGVMFTTLIDTSLCKPKK